MRLQSPLDAYRFVHVAPGRILLALKPPQVDGRHRKRGVVQEGTDILDRLAFIDSRLDLASGARDHLPPEDDVQIRRLNDGASFRVRKVFYEPADLESALRRAGFTEVDVVTTARFFVLGSARRL